MPRITLKIRPLLGHLIEGYSSIIELFQMMANKKNRYGGKRNCEIADYNDSCEIDKDEEIGEDKESGL